MTTQLSPTEKNNKNEVVEVSDEPKVDTSTTEINTDTHTLSDKETREILTPFAFAIDKTLYGTPLAQPSKRGIAILIDLLLISMLSSAPGELLAIVLSITAYKLGSDKRAQETGKTTGRRRRKALRLTGAFCLFIALTITLPAMFSWVEDKTNGTPTTQKESADGYNPTSAVEIAAFTVAIGHAVKEISSQKCVELTCWQDGIEPSLILLNETSMSDQQKRVFVEEIVNETNLSAEDMAALSAYSYDILEIADKTQSNKSDVTNDIDVVSSVPTAEDIDKKVQTIVEEAQNNSQTEEVNREKDSKPAYSLLQLLQGIFIDDLGLGFGWAAFYFTVLTSLWRGQTPGKKLMGIRVVQLDGTDLSLWDSFGRYGGYGAGIATGLVGFAQIFWDANRQAIHDKISLTIVVNKE
ncbi:MAG: RDD family protein [Thalassotalea sp.]|nr:RDD family protein [Thalassotalea sp.]